MKRKNNLSPLPFYTDISFQNQNDWYAYGHRFTTSYEVGFVPPFQLIIEDDTEPIGVLPDTWFEGISINSVQHLFAIDVKDSMIAQQGLTAEKFVGGYIIIKNKSELKLTVPNWNPNSIPGLSSAKPVEGNHFLAINANGNTYTSETFTWKSFSIDRDQKLIRLKYWHNEDFLHPYGHIDYGDDFKHIVNFNSTVGKPSYEFEEDVVKREGYVFPLYQISYKRYRFEFFANEYLLDALRVVRMHDFVEIEADNITYNVDEILIIPTWLEQGNLAQVVCEFTCDTVVGVSGRSIGSSDAYNPPEPPPPSPTINGDFNNDFNDDFFNT